MHRVHVLVSPLAPRLLRAAANLMGRVCALDASVCSPSHPHPPIKSPHPQPSPDRPVAGGAGRAAPGGLDRGGQAGGHRLPHVCAQGARPSDCGGLGSRRGSRGPELLERRAAGQGPARRRCLLLLYARRRHASVHLCPRSSLPAACLSASQGLGMSAAAHPPPHPCRHHCRHHCTLQGPGMSEGSYAPAFPLKHQQKDMR